MAKARQNLRRRYNAETDENKSKRLQERMTIKVPKRTKKKTPPT